MDNLLNRYIIIISYIKDKYNVLEAEEKKEIIRDLMKVEKNNLKDFLFPIYCYFDETLRNKGVDSNLIYAEYGVSCFGDEFNKRIAQEKITKLAVLYELVKLVREHDVGYSSYRACDYKNIKNRFRVVKIKKSFIKFLKKTSVIVVFATFIFTQFNIRYVF